MRISMEATERKLIRYIFMLEILVALGSGTLGMVDRKPRHIAHPAAHTHSTHQQPFFTTAAYTVNMMAKPASVVSGASAEPARWFAAQLLATGFLFAVALRYALSAASRPARTVSSQHTPQPASSSTPAVLRPVLYYLLFGDVTYSVSFLPFFLESGDYLFSFSPYVLVGAAPPTRDCHTTPTPSRPSLPLQTIVFAAARLRYLFAEQWAAGDELFAESSGARADPLRLPSVWRAARGQPARTPSDTNKSPQQHLSPLLEGSENESDGGSPALRLN